MTWYCFFWTSETPCTSQKFAFGYCLETRQFKNLKRKNLRDFAKKCDFFAYIAKTWNLWWKKNGAFRALNSSEWLDIIGEAWLGSYKRIAQVRALILVSVFKRAYFEIWKWKSREILAPKTTFFAFKRASGVRLNFGAFKALRSHRVDSGLSNANFEINSR